MRGQRGSVGVSFVPIPSPRLSPPLSQYSLRAVRPFSRILLGLVLICGAPLPAGAAAHPVRLRCAMNEQAQDGSSQITFRLHCNYPLRSFRLSLVSPEDQPGSPEVDSVLGVVSHHVALRKSRDWRSALGPFVEPPTPAALRNQHMACRRKPGLPRGLHNAHLDCLGRVQPGTTIEGNSGLPTTLAETGQQLSTDSGRFNVCHRNMHSLGLWRGN